MTDTLAMMEDKENHAPQLLGDLLDHRSPSWSPVKAAASRKGRSKSIGPGGLDEIAENVKKDSRQEAKNRRKSTYIPATKAIISADAEKTARQAARRKTLANRRVSFAPEATLHTWDVVEFMRDQTTSTDSSGDTRRDSNVTHDHTTTSDTEDEDTPSSLAKPLPTTKRRRSSGIPPMDFNNPEDAASSSEVSSSSEISGSEDEDEDEDRTQDATITAMSLDTDDATLLSQSSESTNGSTGSSARLEASLRLAAQQAGTRGIDYDEYGDGDLDEEVSMELAEDGITNAFQPWAAQAGLQTSRGSATMDQENINPFSPAFKADMMSTIEEEETGDMSMDVTRAVGNILKTRSESAMSSPSVSIAMDMTQAFGKIHDNQQDSAQAFQGSQKRRRTTSEAGSPGEVAVTMQASKRRRSSAARSSMGDDAMDLTTAVGSINNTAANSKVSRRKSVRHRSSDALPEQADATMDFTQAVGRIQNILPTNHTASSFDENEELTMELTTVLGGIKEAPNDALEAYPATPKASQSPLDHTAGTTTLNQDRLMHGPGSGPTELQSPLLQKQATMLQETLSAEQQKSVSPSKRASRRGSLTAAEMAQHSFCTDQIVSFATELGSRHDVDGRRSSSAVATAQSPARTPIRSMPDTELQVQLDARFQTNHSTERSPTASKKQYSPPAKSAVNASLSSRPSSPVSKDELPIITLGQTSPMHPSPLEATTPEAMHIQVSDTLGRTISTPEQIGEARTIAESIKLMSTPRKEVLKNVTPRKQMQSTDDSPQRMNTTHNGLTSSSQDLGVAAGSAEFAEDLAESQVEAPAVEKVHLQAFLEMAQIRFMELTMTKRRMTTAATPSKKRKSQSAHEELKISLDAAVVAGACSTPELEMYRHACHELKHYISDGKKVIKQLENETYDKTPPLLRAYLQASKNQSSDDRRHVLDTQMRDMKTHARFRSKELWYAWRTQLLEDLVKALSGIAEGLIKDDEILRSLEQIVGEALPNLINREETLSLEAQQLQQAAVQIPEADRLELQQSRKRLLDMDEEVEQKQRLLSELRDQDLIQEQGLTGLLESKSEYNAAIQEAERIREACRGVSLQEIASLKESITGLEETYGWSISSAEASPQTVTMTYKSQLQLYFHPLSFDVLTQGPAQSRPNAPIRLTYIARDGRHNPKELTTTLRFFHQLLRASLQALPQFATPISDLLNFVSGGWDTALAVAEAERSLHLVCPTNSHIVSDERLAIESFLLLPVVRTKVRVAFELLASVGSNGDDEAAGLQLSLTIEPSTKLVYGQTYNEVKMSRTIIDRIDNVEGWAYAVKDLKEQLVIHGARKGMQK